MTDTNKQPLKYELYHYTTCPFCIRVRMALWKMDLDVPLKDISANREYARELTTGGGSRQVPCLRIEDENGKIKWMYESSDIIHYMKQQLVH